MNCLCCGVAPQYCLNLTFPSGRDEEVLRRYETTIIIDQCRPDRVKEFFRKADVANEQLLRRKFGDEAADRYAALPRFYGKPHQFDRRMTDILGCEDVAWMVERRQKASSGGRRLGVSERRRYTSSGPIPQSATTTAPDATAGHAEWPAPPLMELDPYHQHWQPTTAPSGYLGAWNITSAEEL